MGVMADGNEKVLALARGPLGHQPSVGSPPSESPDFRSIPVVPTPPPATTAAGPQLRGHRLGATPRREAVAQRR